MADFSKFRSSLGGFNRSDVANYIEALSAEHLKQMKAEKAEREAVQSQLKELRRELEEERAAKKALADELTQAKAAQEETQKMLEEALNIADEQQEEYSCKELEAYRRAEAMERATGERTAKIRQQLNNLLEETSGRYEQVGQDIKSLSEDLGDHLSRLQEALSELDAVFEETTDRFENINVDEDTE